MVCVHVCIRWKEILNTVGDSFGFLTFWDTFYGAARVSLISLTALHITGCLDNKNPFKWDHQLFSPFYIIAIQCKWKKKYNSNWTFNSHSGKDVNTHTHTPFTNTQFRHTCHPLLKVEIHIIIYNKQDVRTYRRTIKHTYTHTPRLNKKSKGVFRLGVACERQTSSQCDVMILP